MSVAVKINRELAPAAAPLLAPRLYRFTVEQYHRMIEAGVLGGDDRVELLEGWVIEKMPPNPPHDGTIGLLTPRLIRMLPPEWILRVQSAITLARSEPEPDLAIVRGPGETYFKRHALPRDIGLLIEVADSTLLHDRRRKGEVYAGARILQYWILNLVEAKVEVYTQPRAGKAPSYRQRQDYGKGDTVPLVLAGHPIGKLAVRDLLPR